MVCCMTCSTLAIDCDAIYDWPSFHSVFAQALGFPSFYGNNMNAWIDCMSSVDQPDDGMSTIHCQPGSVLTLALEHVAKFRERYPEQYAALIECAAFVNWRRLEQGGSSVLALSFRH